MQIFAKTGASPNAFTSKTMTAYHFSGTEKFMKNLEILLDFVSSPYFTEQNVSKEQGIIGQEIKMYEDDPELPVGTEKVEQYAHTGYKAELYKNVYVDGKLTEHEKVNESVYKSAPKYVKVGTKG